MQYVIIRVYRVAGKNQVEATDRFAEAVALGVERDFHVRDSVKQAEQPTGRRVLVRSWWALIKQQLFG